jgi:hypothetical protein
MSHSLLSTDRGTHFKIVAVALVSAIVLLVIGLTARMDGYKAETADAPVLKAGNSTTVTSRDRSMIR